MQKIQRIYCTHCTYKTSLIERSSSQSDNAVVGYSVRSSSIDGKKTDEIRKVFRAVERLLSYDLPQDTTTERKAQLSAASAPRKMVFQSKLGDNQAVGVISYRTKDTAGRTGSYFADIIVNNLPRNSSGYQQAWTPLAAIQCWPFSYDGSANSNWWCESEEMINSQAPDSTPLPTPAPDLTKLRGDTQAFLNDQLLWAFLTEKTISDSVDKGRIISPRWSNIPVEQRQELFVRVLQALIDISKSNKPRIVLAVEPSVASLIYYGIFRLLPEKFDSLAPGFSFTTYESRPERTPYTLTATTFDQAENKQTDLKTELYSEGFCCNTFGQEGGFKYSKTYGDSFKPGAYTEKLHQIIQSQDKVNFYKFTDSLLECLKPLPNIASQDLDESAELYQEMKTYLLEGVPLQPSSRLLNRSLSGRENILAKSCTCFFLTNHTPKHAPSVDFCVNLINWSGVLSADSGTSKDLREKIFSFVPKTSASLRSLLEAISPLRLPEDVLFPIVVPITAQNKRIPSGFAHWVKETSKQPDQGKYAEKLLGLLDEDTRSVVSLNALDKFPELLFSVLEREAFYRGPNAAKNKSILVECLCAHLKKDNPWQLLLAFPRLTTVIQQVEPGGLNAIRKTLSDSLTRAEKLQSPPQYLDIQGQRDSHRSLQNLRNWVKLTDNKQTERLIHRYEKLIRKFDELAEIKNQSFYNKILSKGVKKNQLREITELIEKLNTSGPLAKTDKPYIKLLETQFRAAGKDIKAFQKAEIAIEEYKNRVPAKLALPQKKTRRKHKVVSVLVPTVILAMLGVASWPTLKNTISLDVSKKKAPEGHAAAAKTPDKQNKNLGKSSERPPLTEGGQPRPKETGNPPAANPDNMASNVAPKTRPPDKAKESASTSTESNPASTGSTVTNPAKKALQANLFACNKIHIKTDVSENFIVVVATIKHNTSTEKNMDDFRFLLVNESGKNKSEASLDKENKIRLTSPSSGGNFSIQYCLKDKQAESKLVNKIFIPPLPDSIEYAHIPTKNIVRFDAKFHSDRPLENHQKLAFKPPLKLVVVAGQKGEIAAKELENVRHEELHSVKDSEYTPDEVEDFKVYCLPNNENYLLSRELPYAPKEPTETSFVEGDKISLEIGKPLGRVMLLKVPFDADIDLGLATPKVLFGGGKDLVFKKNGNKFEGFKDNEKLDWHFEIKKKRWQKHINFVPSKGLEASSAFDLLTSKLVVQCIFKSKASTSKSFQLFNPFEPKSDKTRLDTSVIKFPAKVPVKTFYEPWLLESLPPAEKNFVKQFFLKNLLATLTLEPNDPSLACTATPSGETSTQRTLSIITYGIEGSPNLVQNSLVLTRIGDLELQRPSWSDNQLEKFKDYFRQERWPASVQNQSFTIPGKIGYSSIYTPPETKKPEKFWYQYVKNRWENDLYAKEAVPPKVYLKDIKTELKGWIKQLKPLMAEEDISKEVNENPEIKNLTKLIQSFEDFEDLKKKLGKGFVLKNFDLFWEVTLPTTSKPWLKDYHNKHPNEQRVYWSRFKGQEKDAAGK